MQFAFNTLSRVTPVAHGVCNVVKRVCIIGTSVVFFGNAMTNQTKLGTVIALIGKQHPHQALSNLQYLDLNPCLPPAQDLRSFTVLNTCAQQYSVWKPFSTNVSACHAGTYLYTQASQRYKGKQRTCTVQRCQPSLR
jgi:Triose-phosphate Transporter family